ncbi:hypothetical protein [Nocardia sp. NPDC004415]
MPRRLDRTGPAPVGSVGILTARLTTRRLVTPGPTGLHIGPLLPGNRSRLRALRRHITGTLSRNLTRRYPSRGERSLRGLTGQATGFWSRLTWELAGLGTWRRAVGPTGRVTGQAAHARACGAVGTPRAIRPRSRARTLGGGTLLWELA